MGYTRTYSWEGIRKVRIEAQKRFREFVRAMKREADAALKAIEDAKELVR